MIDVIIRVTVLAVFAVAAVNIAHAVLLSIRLARHLRGGRYGDLGLWFPIFRSLSDAGTWLTHWRSILNSGQPAMVAIRHDGRLIVGRFMHLMLMSNAWGMAVTAVLQIWGAAKGPPSPPFFARQRPGKAVALD